MEVVTPEVAEETQVRQVAKKLKIKDAEHRPVADIKKQIAQQPKAYQADAMKHIAETNVAPAHVNTVDDVLEAIKRYTAVEGFEVKFLDDNQNWHFKCKGAEDSGSMSMKLRHIMHKAEFVSKGRRRLMGAQGFDSNVAKGYADAIISG